MENNNRQFGNRPNRFENRSEVESVTTVEKTSEEKGIFSDLDTKSVAVGAAGAVVVGTVVYGGFKLGSKIKEKLAEKKAAKELTKETAKAEAK